MVPTNFEPFEAENTNSLEKRLIDLWDRLAAKGIDRDFLLSRSMLSPATCCLINPDKEKTVEKAFKNDKRTVRKVTGEIQPEIGCKASVIKFLGWGSGGNPF